MPDFSAAEWTSIGVALATLCLAFYTARMANATKEMAKSSESQLQYLKAQVDATNRGVDLQQRAVELTGRPKLKLFRVGADPEVRFEEANLDGTGGGHHEDRLFSFFKNVGGGTANEISARLFLSGGQQFESEPIPDLPAEAERIRSVSFAVPRDLLIDGQEIVIQVDYEGGAFERERVDLRLAPSEDASKWIVLREERYGPPN